METLKSNPLAFDKLSQALPTTFDFYHLGQVELQPESFLNIEHEPLLGSETGTGVGFRIQGDIQATLILLVKKGLDLSIYSELGNILASKIANQLFKDEQLQIMISPPQLLSEKQLTSVLMSSTSTVRRTYLHHYQGQLIYVETLFLSWTTEEIGNA